MAKPLGQVVFKVPELGKQGYQLELQQEARQEKREKERDREIYRTGGESAFNDNAYKLKGRYLTEAQDLYKEFERVGAMFKQTNDPSLLRKANELSNQIKSVVNDFNTQVGIPLKLAAQADTKQWQGYMGNRDDFDKDMEAVLADVPHKIINNRMHYLWQGEYLPKEQTPWGSGKPNEYNTVMVRETTDLGKYVVPSYYEKGLSSLAENAYSKESLMDAVSRQFDYDLENIPTLAADVAVAYAIHAKKLSGKSISATDMQEFIAKYSDPNAPSLTPNDGGKSFKESANSWYKSRLMAISSNRYAATTGEYEEASTETKEETPAESATGETTTQTASGITIDDSPEDIGLVTSDTQPVATETPTAEETNTQGAPVLNPPAPTPAERVGMEEAAKPPTEVELPRTKGETTPEPELQEVTTLPDTKEGMTETSINVRVATDKKGKSEIINITRTLPEYYTDNLLEFEGGISTSTGDPAAKPDRNKNAPIVNGKKAHTNKGVTYDKYEEWANSIGMPKKDQKDRFLKLTDAEALAVAEGEAARIGANNFSNQVLSALFTQNTWAGGVPYLALQENPKTGQEYSQEYRAIEHVFKKNGIELSRFKTITKEDAEKIDALFESNPKQFIDDYFDAYYISHTRMDSDVFDKEGSAGFGKNTNVPNYMYNRNGWHRRANKFKKALSEQIGIEYTPIKPFNKTRKYIKEGNKFILVEEREGKFVPVGRTDWIDSYQPITDEK